MVALRKSDGAGAPIQVPALNRTTMSSRTSTTYDISDSPPPATRSTRRYACDEMTVFKVEGTLFRFDRKLLDQETDTIPRGAGSSDDDPIQLEHIRSTDFEILLDFLELGTRHDKKPLTAVDWASIIAVCSVLGLQRVLTLAYKTLSDQQNDPLNVSRAGVGFERDTYGMFFLIREKGSDDYLSTYDNRKSEGVHLRLWRRKNKSADDKESQVFFVDRYGALHHAASGLAIDIIDDVPVLRRDHPVASRPNPWSHPLAEFSFVDSQIRVKFLSDPSLPSCSDDLYPKDSWATKNFVLATHSEKDFHLHPISDFSPWIPVTVAGSLKHDTEANHNKGNRVLVEERTEDVGGARTSWEIVPALSQS